MLDIPLQQSGILTFMSLKKLMSVQAAIVRPTHPPPSSLHLPLVPQRESVSFQLLGVLWQKLHCTLWRQFIEILREKELNFFSFWWETSEHRDPARTPISPVVRQQMLVSAPFLSLVTFLLWGTSVKPPAVCWGEGFPLHTLPPLKAKKSTRAKLGGWWAVVSHHKWHRHSCVLTDVPLKLVEGEPTDSSCRFCHPARTHKRIHCPYVRVCVYTSL